MDSEFKKKTKIILDYLAISDSLDKVDAIFLVGGDSLMPARKAAELYKKGYAPAIFNVTRGGNFGFKGWKEAGGEGNIFKKEMIRLGVPEKSIYVKNEAMNTLEETQMALPFIKKHISSPKSLILVDKPVHQRRGFATFKKHYPDIKFINSPANEKIKFNQITINRVVKEINRLIIYGVKGDIVPQKIPEKVLRAWKKLYSLAKIS